MFDGNAPISFDATVDIPESFMPPGMRPYEAVYRGREALEAMPGAGWVSVDYAGIIPPEVPWIVLYAAGSAEPLDPLHGLDLAARIESAVRLALG